jgi:GT2 family glycosyltransferase
MKEPRFSILIPSWNNLPHLMLCINSIKKNSHYTHQIVVHVNEGLDETNKWLGENKIEYTFSAENIGICKAVNEAFKKAEAKYIVYMNDDMYVCPQWDLHLMNEIEQIGHNRFFLSSTMIEPEFTGNRCAIAPLNYGNSPQNFEEEKLLKEYDKLDFSDWNGSTWPPNIVHRDLWKAVGGYSEEFSPGMYSDPDFAMKLWKTGVRHFKGIGKSRVYHFMSKSTGKVKKNKGRIQFLRKWGIPSSRFTRQILKSGEPFSGELPDTEIKPDIKDKIKGILGI